MDSKQQLSEWFDFKEGVYKCKVCTIKVFENNRPDNCQRHVNEKHLKKLKECECGRKMTASSLSRHRKKHCTKRNKGIAQAPPTFPETPPESPTDRANGIHEYLVNIKVKFETKPDGTKTVSHDEISIGGFQFGLTPIVSFEGNSIE